MKKLLSLFLSLLLFLWIIPFPLDNFNFLYEYVSYISKAVNNISAYLGKLFFNIELNEMQMLGGSSDSILGYLRLFTSCIFAFLETIILYFSKKLNGKIQNLYKYIYLYARYFLGLTLIGYGMVKLTGLQFGNSLSYIQLEQSFGEATPMGMLWKFMTSSKEYTVFTGFVEIISGLLLLFRKTLVLGIVLSFMSLLQVVVLNYTFDVSVKVFSSKLLIICLFLLFPFLSTLFNFFIKNEKVKLEIESLKNERNHIKTILKYLIIIGIPLISYLETKKYIDNNEPKYLGSYYFNKLYVNKDTVNVEDKSSKIIIDKYVAKIKMPKKNASFFEYSYDSIKNSVTFKSYIDTTLIYDFKYENLVNNKYRFSGYDSDSTYYEIFLDKKVRRDYNLYKERFHWITEFPRNR